MMRTPLVLGVLVAAMVALQGCDVAHDTATWRRAKNYLAEFSYDSNATSSERKVLKLNSCDDASMDTKDQCNGHGHCGEWFDMVGSASLAGSVQSHVRFCKCDSRWAGPECDTQRKSQLIAYMLSLFFGVFGVDQLYLGFPWLAALKLVTLGGAGVWWLYDLIRIGSAPVLAHGQFKVANDLSHGVFVLSALFVVGFVGFAVSLWSVKRHSSRKTREMLRLQGGPSSATPAYGSAVAHPPTAAATAFPVTPMRRTLADEEIGRRLVGGGSSAAYLQSGDGDSAVFSGASDRSSLQSSIRYDAGYTPASGTWALAASSYGMTGSPTATPLWATSQASRTVSRTSASEADSAFRSDVSMHRSP